MEKRSDKKELAGIVYRNIDSLIQMRKQFDRERSFHERLAHSITRFIGSMKFIYAHTVLIIIWLLVDRSAFPKIATLASIEAIFLSTFVLIAQNRMQKLSEKRTDLDLQVNLLSEHEVTHLIHLVDAIAAHLGVRNAPRADDFKREVAPEVVLEKIEEAEERLVDLANEKESS